MPELSKAEKTDCRAGLRENIVKPDRVASDTCVLDILLHLSATHSEDRHLAHWCKIFQRNSLAG